MSSKQSDSRRERWSEKRIEEELRAAASEIGHWPTTRELRAAGRGDLVEAVRRNDGMTAWAKRLGYEPNQRGGQQWTEENIRTTLQELIGESSSFPTRNEFEEAGLQGLWKTLANHGELGRWAQKLGVDPPKRGRPRKAPAEAQSA